MLREFIQRHKRASIIGVIVIALAIVAGVVWGSVSFRPQGAGGNQTGPPAEQLSGDMQAQKDANTVMNQEIAKKYPIAKYLPHNVDGKYYIKTWAASGDLVVLTVKVVPVAVRQDTVPPETLAGYQGEINDWLRSKGLDPAGYRIDFVYY